MRAWIFLLGACGRVGFDGGNADVRSDATAAAYAAEVLADQPLAYFRFNETSGPTAHSEVGSYTGTYQGNFEFGATGAVGDNSVVFDGVTTRIDLGDVFRFPGTAPHSIEIWLNTTDLVDTRFLVVRRSTSGDGYHLYIGATYTIFVRMVGLAEDDYASATSGPPIGTWQHLVGTYDGITTQLYVDGVENSNFGETIAIADEAGSFIVGDDEPPQFRKFDGRLDELAIYDHALPADRVLAHLNAAGPK